MRVFVTGNLGYIGSHLVNLLKQEGHFVTGCDLGLFEDCKWTKITQADVQLYKDVRDLTEKDLDNHDCVMHLAAISNDPMGDLNPEITTSINRDGTIHTAQKAKNAGVPRFLFASSCAMYGKGERDFLTENDSLHPLTTYARSKIEAEKILSEMATDSFSPVYLRNSTAYGASPRLRIDLVVNNLLACAVAQGIFES